MEKNHATIVKEEIENLSGESLPNNDTNFFEENILDSLNIINLVVFVESTFEVPVDPLDVSLENFGTVNKIVSYIKENSKRD